MKKYSQINAMLAVTRASLRSIFRSPSAVVFSIVFPMVFIIVFGFMGNTMISVTLGVNPQCDTTSQYFKIIAARPEIKLKREPLQELNTQLKKGKIAAILNIQPGKDSILSPVIINLETSSASREGAAVIRMFMEHAVDKANLSANPKIQKVAELRTQEVPVRKFKSIDFILPGMLGFSLLSTGVFGTAFVFFNLRNTLVLKRFFATPIRRSFIVMGEALSRVTFATITSSFIIILGHYAFGFTLVNGVTTFLLMLILMFLGLFVFMGLGFVVSSMATYESTIPVLANIITLPQFLMAGTFFPTDAFTPWLQPVTKILPLTYLNDALRKIAFEGVGLADISGDILILVVWGVVIYATVVKVFKWE